MRRRTTLPTIALKTTTPCCGGAMTLRRLLDVPRETFERRCVRCGKRWTIAAVHSAASSAHARIDILTWEWTTTEITS